MRIRGRRGWLLSRARLCILSAAVVCPAVAGQAPEAFVATHAALEDLAKPAFRPYSEFFGLEERAGFEFNLGPIDLSGIFAEDEQAREAGDKTLRIGIQRGVGADIRHGRWIDVVGGRLWILDVLSAGAVGLRLHFDGMAIPAGAGMVVYSPLDPAQVHGPYEGAGHLGTGEFWSPTVEGSRARVEYFVPEDAPEDVNEPFMIDAAMHVYRDPLADANTREGSCHNDVSCDAAWATTAKAVAGVATAGSFSLYCSGQMLNSQNGDMTPYWLTANHCVATSGEASSAEIYWLFQKASCGGSSPSILSVPRSQTCTLLSTGTSSDFSLLMIEGTVPRSQIAWAGWTAASVTNGTGAVCIHHPDGAYKRISYGSKATASPSCGGSNHVRVSWTSGVTEPGSSGSGAFRNDVNQQLFGQLHCGPSSCASVTHDDYGAFTNSYLSLSTHLTGGPDDTREDNDACAMAYSLGIGAYTSLVVKSTDEDWYAIALGDGQSVTITLNFTHAYGDIDCGLHSDCIGSLLATSLGTGNSEVINFTNNGDAATFYLRVYLATDTRNSYSMTVAQSCTIPGTPTEVSASDAGSCTLVNVTWAAVVGATGFEVWRGASTSTASAGQIGSSPASPYSDTSATPGQAYYYFVKATNACGPSAFSLPDSGVRAAGPGTPTGVGASDSTECDAVVVSWPSVAGASGYQVWRAPVNSLGSAAMIGAPGASPFSDMSATPGITYFFWVVATGPCGASGFSGSDGGTRTKVLGDADTSGTVNFTDVTVVLSNWGASYLPSPGTGPGDANADALVNFTDVGYVLANWGAHCP